MALGAAADKSPKAPVGEVSPRHVIVFREPSADNALLMSKTLGTGEDKRVSARASCAVFAPKVEGQPRPRLYHRLGVAVADLNSEELEQLRKDQRVTGVVPNELRFIPPIAEQQAIAHSHAPSGVVSTGRASDPILAYLHGLRDAAEAAIRFATGIVGRRPDAITPGATESRGHSWCLDIIGLDASYTTATGMGIKVAVLDTGIDLRHRDFIDAVTPGVNAASFVPGESVMDTDTGRTVPASSLGRHRRLAVFVTASHRTLA